MEFLNNRPATPWFRSGLVIRSFSDLCSYCQGTGELTGPDYDPYACFECLGHGIAYNFRVYDHKIDPSVARLAMVAAENAVFNKLGER